MADTKTDATLRLDETAIEARLGALPDWAKSGDVLQRTFACGDLLKAMAFVNAVAEAAEVPRAPVGRKALVSALVALGATVVVLAPLDRDQSALGETLEGGVFEIAGIAVPLFIPMAPPHAFATLSLKIQLLIVGDPSVNIPPPIAESPF